MDIAANGCVGDGQRGVNRANKKTQKSKLNKNSPAVPPAAFAGRSAAAALQWWPSDGREEERRRGVSTTDEKHNKMNTNILCTHHPRPTHTDYGGLMCH